MIVARLRDQRGYTALELMFACTLFVALLVTALKPLDSFWGINRDTDRQNETQEATRLAVDRIVTELRSAGGQAQSIEKAGPFDIVFARVDADPETLPADGGNETGVQRVRYCKTGSTLIRQEMTWTTATPPDLGTQLCPDLAPWSTAQHVATDVTNGTTPLFTYNQVPCGTGAAPALDQIDAVGVCLMLERPVKDGERRRPTELATIVAIRNEVDGQ